MYIYNENKLEEVARALDFQGDFDEMCAYIFNRYGNSERFEFIDEGSDRTAVLVKGTNVVVKIAHKCSCYQEDSIDCQGAIEKMTYDEYRNKGYIAEFYGFSNNFCIIFMERLMSVYNFEIIKDKDTNFVEYVKKYCGDRADEGTLYIFIDNNIETYIKEYYGSDIYDVHASNIGFDSEGNVKILDLGYGDGYVEYKVIDEIFEKNLDKPIYGITKCNNAIIYDYCDSELSAHSQSSKRFY